ncbi:hypothetical protein BCON_0249g00150 [Botryotinia convoluta]|uniref:Uncharacterized protein n=1 Tax=Botryotinia convoluta TaxID=54673 RepID=A0A4Z1HTM1_9HELO|nr:hypothetical protein BCON_0249g00150 [Botryotinia convoluta]
MSSPPPQPQPQPQDCRSLISSPDRVYRWIEGTGEFNDQPISPSNNVPNSPLSGNQYVMDDGVNLRSPSIGSRPGASHDDVFAASFNQEGAQVGADFTGNNQQPNQETSNALLSQPQASYYNMLGQIQQRNEYRLRNIYEYSPIPNSVDNAHQGIHDGNNRVDYPSNSTALQNSNNYSGNMMPMNNYSSQPRYGGLQPPSQRAHQTNMTTGMTTGMMNTMNNYQSGMSGQVSENNPVHSVNPTHHFARFASDLNTYRTYTNYDNGVFWDDPRYQEAQRNDHMLCNCHSNMASTQLADQGHGDRMSTNHLPYMTPQHVILDRFEDSPYNSRPNANSQQTSDEDQSYNSLTTPSNMTSNQYAVRDTQSPVPATPSGYASDQRAPGPVGTGLDVPNVLDNMPPNQHIVHNEQDLDVANVLGNMLPSQHIVRNEQDSDEPNVPSNMPPSEHTVRNDQGDMPTSSGDQMDTPHDQILFGKPSTIAPLAQPFDLILDAAQPFNAINSGPSFPQDNSLRQLLQLDSNPTPTSNIEETGAALDSGEADTRSVRDFPPNIPGTLASNVHQPQTETPQASNPLRNIARNQKADTRKDSSRAANRVNKSIRRRKPAKTQKLQSAIANSASHLLEGSTTQAVEAQNDSETSVESEE